MESNESFFLEITLNSDDVKTYNDLHQGIELIQPHSFYLWLLTKVQLPIKGKFLDIACGSGELIKLVSQQGIFAVGIDLSATAVTKGKLYNEYIVQCKGEDLPFPDNYFDVVTNIGSLEHFKDPCKGVMEITRVLQSTGQAYILVPNTYSLFNNFWHAFRWGTTAIDNQPIQRYGSRLDWTNLLRNNGLVVLDTIKYELPWPQTKSDWNHYFKKPKALIKLFLSPLVPLNLAFCFLFICRKYDKKVDL